MKIDAHQHFWVFDPIRDAWINEEMAVIRQDFLPENLQPILFRHNIEACVAVQADQSEIETEFLLGLSQTHSFIKGVVGWTDLRAKNVDEKLEHYAQYQSIKGFRHIVQGESDDFFMLRTEFLNGIKALSKHNFSYDLLIFPHQLASAKQLVARFGHQPFVLDHLAKPYIKKGLIDQWKTDLNELAKHDNVFCKISGMVTEANLQTWSDTDLRPYLDVAFEAFGTDRLMFGSDWPVCLLAAEYDQVVNTLANYLEEFSSDEKSKIWGLNAQRFYRI